MSVASAAKIKRMTEAKCLEWAETPLVNPTTGRAIELHKGTYLAIAERCKNAFGIDPSGDYAAESEVAKSRRLLPKKVGDWTVPRTEDEWVASDVRKKAVALSKAVAKFGFITERHVQDAAAFSKIGRLLLDAEIIPAAERAAAENIIATLTEAMIPASKIREYASVPKEIADYHYLIRRITSGMIAGDPLTTNLSNLRNDIVVTQFNNYAERGAGALTQEDVEVDEMLIALTALQSEMILQRTNATAAEQAGDEHAIPASRERSLPESLSQRRVKQMKPKRRAEDPDEYYPWSATEEAAPTDRSRFRSHAKLSAVSPGPQPSPGAAPLPPLDPKKRTALLAELREACTVMKDMISMQRFDRMNKKALQLVVRLGSGRRSGAAAAAAAGNERCYYVRNLYQLWANAAKTGAPLADPLTRDRVTADEKADIMGKIRHLRPNAPDLRNPKHPRDPKITLDIQQKIVPFYREAGSDTVGTIGVYALRTVRKVGPRAYVVHDLGFVPSDVELADVNGDANLTSSAVIAGIRRLFDDGRLLSQNFVPYRCCTIHLRKPVSYWTKRTSGSPMRNNVNMRLWNLMASEIYAAL